MTRHRALMLATACLLVAALLRLPGLTHTPPGLHYDEAANGILAGDIGLRGERPVFIPSYTGKEPLFFYAAGSLMRALGDNVFTLRLAAAFLGILTVAVTYWLGRELLADRRIAIIAAALIAVSFWHVLFSRLGFRAISQPLLQALAVAFLFRGLKREQLLPCVMGGIFLGLAAYTYLAVRVFPILLILTLPPLLISTRRRLRLSQWGVFALSGLAVSLPLMLYFYQHPAAFWVRISQVGPSADNPGLLESYLRSLGMLFLLGDPYWRFNIPGRPVFNWFWGGLLVAGWVILLLRWRRWWYDWQKASVVLLLFAPLVMILPTSLALNEIVPSNLRALGLMPFVYFLPAVGLVYLLEQVANILRRPDLNITRRLQQARLLEAYDINYAFVVALILVLGGLATRQAYFEEWVTREDLYYDSDADLVTVADFLAEAEQAEQTVYVASLHYRHPTLAFLSERYDEIKWLPNSEALVFPASGSSLIIYPRSSPPPAWATDSFSEPIQGPEGPDGLPTFTAYENPQLPVAAYTISAADFSDLISLLGYDLGPAQSGGVLPLTLYWLAHAPSPEPLTMFVHLEDERGHRWSQVESFAYPSEQWAPGETILQHVELPIPAGTPPGDYRLRVGFFNPDSGARLPRLDEAGRYAGDSRLIERAVITPGPPPSPLPSAPRGRPEPVRPGLDFLGYERGTAGVRQGEQIDLALWWHATTSQPDMTMRLEMIGPDNSPRRLLDAVPVNNTYPFDQWQPPAFIVDRIDPPVPTDLPPGQYQLELTLLEQGVESLFATSLGSVTVEETRRSFIVPAIETPTSARFGNAIELLGYELIEVSPDIYRFTLIWRAIEQPAEDYKVFVHLLSPNGLCCQWQSDSDPVQGTYPTSGWLPGEVIVDTYEIRLPPDAPPGVYPIELGFFLSETGQRLLVTQPGLPDSDAFFPARITLDP